VKEPSNVHTTLSPRAMVRFPGENENSWTDTKWVTGAATPVVVVGVVVVGAAVVVVGAAVVVVTGTVVVGGAVVVVGVVVVGAAVVVVTAVVVVGVSVVVAAGAVVVVAIVLGAAVGSEVPSDDSEEVLSPQAAITIPMATTSNSNLRMDPSCQRSINLPGPGIYRY
jgi:hypothetical protein